MTGWDLLALLLIVCPVEPLPNRAPEALRQALIRTARGLDLVGDVEHWTPNFAAEVRWCRRTLVHLADAPPSTDACRFPANGLARDGCRMNSTYQRHLEARQAFDLRRRVEWSAVLRETQQLATIWEAVAVAANTAEWVVHRRRALRRLHTLLGPGAYYSGQMPPCVPLWHFQPFDSYAR